MKTSSFRTGILGAVILMGTLAACTFPVTTGDTETGKGGQGNGSQVAAALGVSEATLQACIPRPTERPTAGTQPTRPDASAITTCLQAENSSLTTSAVEAALAKSAPQRPQR